MNTLMRLVRNIKHRLRHATPQATKKASKFFRYCDFILRNVGKIIFGVFFIGACAVYLIPSITLAMGDIFFGGIKPLYNIKWAQRLYEHAVDPPFGQVAPRYAHHQLSRTHFIQGENYAAIAEAQKELALYPDDTATYYILGLTYGYMGREHDAIDAFSRYIDTHPETWAGRNDKAWLQFRIGDIDGALETIRPAVTEYPLTPWVQNTYCGLLIGKKEYARANEVCRHAKNLVDKLTEEGWGRSYPGNDPRIYGTGVRAMRMSIDQNISLIEENLKKQEGDMQ